MSYHTIIHNPLAPLRPMISTRSWNLVDRAGYQTFAELREAQRNGELKDVRNMGPVALLEIRLALDSLPGEPDSRDGVLPFARIADALDVARLHMRNEEPGWVIDQMIRALCGAGREGTTPEYLEFTGTIEARRSSAPFLDPENDPASYTPETYPQEFLDRDLARARGESYQPPASDPVVFGEPWHEHAPSRGIAYRHGAGSGWSADGTTVPMGAVPDQYQPPQPAGNQPAAVPAMRPGTVLHAPEDWPRSNPDRGTPDDTEFEGYDMSDVQPPPWRLGQGWEQERGGL